MVFKALADPTRRRLLDVLHERAGLTLGELCDGLEMRRQSVSEHLGLLEAAGLVTVVRSGRRRLHYLNPVPIHDIRTRWIWKFEESSLGFLDQVKARAQEITMIEPVPAYVYTTYIHSTPDDVWRALTSPDLTGRFWGHAQVSDWAVGSRVEHVRVDGSDVVDAVGRVLEVAPPLRLVFGFDTPTRFDDPTFEPSVVTFTIEPYAEIVRLTVTHTNLPDAAGRESISLGWPAVFANLKTLLETGDVLPQDPWTMHAPDRERTMQGN
ncbi:MULTISPECIES: metalloregulator ArsR/SmtB family transcription factor [unclassified Pseudofrankia]|uniref:ArsR/SmtB family transcription factor n=1 Tax=unclassified Pseudofrankia TaxID=2994372 RepID=UPI0008D9DB8C|nr:MULTISPECIES: metalloregulator ArsR/SmtB family transcription factor [unclassified Pseudofrankia]MDT3438136.1 metalloregulator ArsR/SmtB family transcription factor [Pseudofrankia sp. BMG5.37]OHV56840.1 ArsR family transcriptional regulator [Pseudofrankia sp. BMG5.36]